MGRNNLHIVIENENSKRFDSMFISICGCRNANERKGEY